MKNKSNYLKYGLHIAIFVGLVWAIVKYVNGQEVWKALQSFAYIYLPFMVGLSLFHFLLKAVRFTLLMSPFTKNLPKRTIPTLFLAFIVPTMLGRIVPVPGGVGVTEASMVGFLTSTTQLDTNTTVAAVAIFRIVAIVIPVILGAMVYYFFWKGEDEINGSKMAQEQTESTEASLAQPAKQ